MMMPVIHGVAPPHARRQFSPSSNFLTVCGMPEREVLHGSSDWQEINCTACIAAWADKDDTFCLMGTPHPPGFGFCTNGVAYCEPGM